MPDEVQQWVAYTAAVSYFLHLKGAAPEVQFWVREAYGRQCKAELLYQKTDWGIGSGANKLVGSYGVAF